MKFSDFIDVRDGTHDSPKSVAGTGYPLVTTKHLGNGVIDFSNTNNISEEDYIAINQRSKVDKFDILISMIGTVGSVYQERHNEPGYAIKNVGLLKFNGDETLSNYVYYWLKGSNGQNEIKARLKGTTQQFLSLTELRNLEIELPSRDEMDLAVKPLMLLDQKMYSLVSINDNLLELASELVNHSSQTQGRETTPLNDVLSSEKVVSKTVQGLDPNTYISTTNMLPGKAGVTSDVDLPASGKAKMYKPGDILIANIRPYFKKIWFSDKSGSYSNDVLNFRANEGIVSREFLWGLLYSDDFFDYVVATSKGTKMPRGDKDAIAKYELRLPDYKEVQRITRVISPMLEMVSLNNLEIINLTQTRDAFLSNLID